MTYLIGLAGCSKCKAKMEELESKGIPYEYREFKELPLTAKKILSDEYRDEEGVIRLPILVDDPVKYALNEVD